MSLSENNKRIARNTMILYVRMFVMMFISFFTTRIVLNALGVDDYGINNVVGGLVAMFSLLSGSLTSASSRFITFALGKGDLGEQKKVFATTINIHLILAVVVLLALELVGVWFLNHKMNIAPDRLYAANWVLQSSVVVFVLGILSVPYNSAIIAHERMSAFAWVTLIDAFFKLIVAYVIYYYSGDRLILYALLLIVPSIFDLGAYYWYCRRNFEECHYSFMWDKATFREMLGFSVWNFIGSTAAVLKDQGVNILINLFFSTVVNAARGVAMQINSIVNQFTSNFTMAINPQITKYYASGDLPRMHRLVFYGTRMSYYLFMFIAIPVFFEIDAVLLVWLGQVPEHTVLFVRLILILTLTEILSRMLITAQAATGRVRNYQLVVGGLLLLNFPLSYVALKLGYSPESTVVVGIIVSLICLVARLWFLRTSVALRVRDFVSQVVVNVVVVTLLSSVVPAVCYYFIEHHIIRFFAVCVSSVVMSAVVIYFVGCNSWERDMLRGYVVKFMNKILHR